MTAYEFLKSKGIKVESRGEKLLLRPKELINDEVKEYVIAHKREILEELSRGRVVWRNPHAQGTLEARRESLTQCVDAIRRSANEKVKWHCEREQKQHRRKPDIVRLERRVEALRKAVLKGNAKLSDFGRVIDDWAKAVEAELN